MRRRLAFGGPWLGCKPDRSAALLAAVRAAQAEFVQFDPARDALWPRLALETLRDEGLTPAVSVLVDAAGGAAAAEAARAALDVPQIDLLVLRVADAEDARRAAADERLLSGAAAARLGVAVGPAEHAEGHCPPADALLAAAEPLLAAGADTVQLSAAPAAGAHAAVEALQQLEGAATRVVSSGFDAVLPGGRPFRFLPGSVARELAAGASVDESAERLRAAFEMAASVEAACPLAAPDERLQWATALSQRPLREYHLWMTVLATQLMPARAEAIETLPAEHERWGEAYKLASTELIFAMTEALAHEEAALLARAEEALPGSGGSSLEERTLDVLLAAGADVVLTEEREVFGLGGFSVGSVGKEQAVRAMSAPSGWYTA